MSHLAILVDPILNSNLLCRTDPWQLLKLNATSSNSYQKIIGFTVHIPYILISFLKFSSHGSNAFQECLKSDGKPLRHILNADNPAMYVSVDGNHDIKKFKRAERTRLFKKFTNDQLNQKHLLQDLADGRSQWLNDLKFIQDLQNGGSRTG